MNLKHLVPVFLFIWNAIPQVNIDAHLTRPFTLRTIETEPLETEYHRQISSGKGRSYIFPRPCLSYIDSSSICSPHTPKLKYNSPDSLKQLNILLIGGTEYRKLDDIAGAINGGINTWGLLGPLSFYLDTRMYVEFHENFYHASFDREFVERQDEEASGSVAFSSFSRYRTNLSMNFDWARISAGRNSLHWGPGQFENLVFHHNSIPFNQIKFEGNIGPFKVSSVYAQLAIDGGDKNRASLKNRSLYAHRYEWNVFRGFYLE